MGTLIVTVTVDWEGTDLQSANLKSMSQFNTEAPLTIGSPVPVTHFFCPAYFVRLASTTDKDSAKATIIKSGAIEAHHEIGLHIHSWKSLIPKTITFNNAVQYDPWSPRLTNAGTMEAGHNVPLGVYSTPQVIEIMKASIAAVPADVLGITKQSSMASFRCGGWVACDNVLGALPSVALVNDASAFPYDYVPTCKSLKDVGGIVLWDYLNSIWGTTKYTGSDTYLQNSMSFTEYNNGVTTNGVNSQPKGIGPTKEMPDVAVLADYINIDTIKKQIDAAVLMAQSSPTVQFSMGFHQETASLIWSWLGDGLTNAERILQAAAYALTQGRKSTPEIPVKFLKISDAAKLS